MLGGLGRLGGLGILFVSEVKVKVMVKVRVRVKVLV